MKFIYTILSILFVKFSLAQTVNNTIAKANDLYRKGDHKNAETTYDAALKLDNKNTTAIFNKGNSLFKQNKYDDAIKQYEATASNTTDTELQAKAYYNKAVAEIKQQKLQQALQSLKQSLTLNNNDERARENLQKLLTEINKQKQQQQQPKPKEEKPKDKPLSKEQAAKQLEMLRNAEKQLQKDIQEQKNKPSRQEKDW